MKTDAACRGGRTGRLGIAWGSLAVGIIVAVSGRAAEPTADLSQRRETIQKRTAEEFSRLEDLYKHLHTHPELSLHEKNTSARLAQELREIGF